jgi:hypothetical protein
MAEIERDGDDVLIRMKVSELEDLAAVLEKTGNSSCRERHRYPEGSLPWKFRMQWAQAAWDWAENFSIHRPKSSHIFSVKIKEL